MASNQVPPHNSAMPANSINFPRPAATPSFNNNFPVRGPPEHVNSFNVGPYAITSQKKNNVLGAEGGLDSVACHYLTLVESNNTQQNEDVRSIGQGHLCFVRNLEFVPAQSTKAKQYGVQPGSASADIREVTQLNRYLRQHPAHYTSASAVATEWRLLGAVRNETAPYGARGVGEKHPQRILNFVASHYASIYNLWTESTVHSAQNLYLIIRKNTQHGCYEIAAWTHHNRDAPRLADLKPFPPDDSIGDLGVAIYVGKAVSTLRRKRAGQTTGFTDIRTSRAHFDQGLSGAPVAVQLLI
jgi:hypothetical protein